MTSSACFVPGLTTIVAVVGADHALVVAELEADLPLDDRPVLLLVGVEVGRQAAARLDPGFDARFSPSGWKE